MISSERVNSVLRGHGELQSQRASEWTAPLPLPPELERYYREIGPVDITIDDLGNPFFLPALATLWDFQAGYRWRASSGEALSDWDDDWLVVADQGGDPFIFSRNTGRISLAHHGTGAWDPKELFTDLNEMACCLSLLGSVVAESEDQPLDDDGNIGPEYKRAAEFGLTDLVGSPERAAHILAILGWG
jgi:hypothetical protein